MDDVIPGKVDVGRIVGIITPFIPYSHAEFVLVMNNYDIIPIRMNGEQQEYVHESYQIGKKVAIAFFNGQWHIGIPGQHKVNCQQTSDEMFDELWEEQVRYLKIVEQNFRNDVDRLLAEFKLDHLKVTRAASSE